MKKKAVIIIALLGLAMLAAVKARSIQSSPEEVLPPGILPVVMLGGSDYEMGYQYGQQAGAYIELNTYKTWATALQSFDRETVVRTLKANQHFIREYTPENIKIMKGMADGAKAAGHSVSYTDVLLLNCTLPKPETSTYPEGAGSASLPPKSCSVCSAWGTATKEGRVIGMDTLDQSGEASYSVIIVAFPDRGNPYICGAKAGEVGDHFLMNNKGLMIGNSGGGGSPRDRDNNYGLSWSCSLPHMARFADNAEEAKEMVMNWQINIPENFHFVDIGGRAYVVEKTAAVQSVRMSGDFGEKDFLFSTNNYLNAAMKVTKKGGFIGRHGGYGAYSAPRNLILWDLLNNYHGEIDVEFIKMILRFPGEPPPYPPEGGWDAKICRPSNSWVSVMLPAEGDQGSVHICTGPAGRVIHSSAASDGSKLRSNYPYIDGTHTFYQLVLAAKPRAVVEEAQKTARRYLADAYGKLMHVKPTDSCYPELNRIYSDASADLYRGHKAFNRAMLSDGNESMAYLARAATAYTRSQAHAGQVYEALVPPPTSPSDLGLRPFGAGWGTWETKVGTPK